MATSTAKTARSGSGGGRRRRAAPPPVAPLPPAEARVRTAQRVLLGLAAVALPLLFTRNMMSAFAVPKALLLWLIGGALVAVALVGVGVTRRVTLSWPAVSAAVGVLTLGLVVGTVTSASPLRSFVGSYDRQAGLLSYACGIVLLATAATALRQRDESQGVASHPAATLVRLLIGVTAVVTFYGGLQLIGADPFGWTNRQTGSTLIATFGNRNFVAGWLGTVGVLALWGTVTRSWGDGFRVACGFLAALVAAQVVLTDSAQGPLAWGIAAAVFAAVYVTGEASLRRRVRRLAPRLLAIGVLGVVLVAFLVTGDRPGAGFRAGVERSAVDRITLAQAGWSMGLDAPLTGQGLELYLDHYHEHRPLSRSLTLNIQPAGDNAHNVAMQLFGGAGLLALLGWLGWVGTVGTVLVRGLRQLTGERRLLLGAVGAAWIGYLVQALVSIDIPPLLATGWLLSGTVLAVAPTTLGGPTGHRTWSRTLPGPAALAAAALAVAVVVGGLIPWSVVFRAELAGARAARTAEVPATIAATERTLALTGWEPRYPLRIARRASEQGDHERASDLYARAVEINPRYTLAYYEGARSLARQNRNEEAAAYWEQVLALAPETVAAMDEAAGFFASIGEQERAHALTALAAEVRARAG